jgi:transposase-like protein
MNIKEYFQKHGAVKKRQYDALRELVTTEATISDVAKKYGYSEHTLSAYLYQLKQFLKEHPDKDFFFQEKRAGRRRDPVIADLEKEIVALRLQNLSITDIKSALGDKSHLVSERTISNILLENGFKKLPRRAQQEIQKKGQNRQADDEQNQNEDKFSSLCGAIFLFVPLLDELAYHQIINETPFPESEAISKQAALLTIISLKLSAMQHLNMERFSLSDPSLALFADLPSLPQARWFKEFSQNLSSESKLAFLKNMHRLRKERQLLGQGLLISRLAVEENELLLAQDSKSGLYDFISDFPQKSEGGDAFAQLCQFYVDERADGESPVLMIDNRAATLAELRFLDEKGFRFYAPRRSGKKLVNKLKSLSKKRWQSISYERDGKKSHLTIYEEKVTLQGYSYQLSAPAQALRQFAFYRWGENRPTLIISNDLESSLEEAAANYVSHFQKNWNTNEELSFFGLNGLRLEIEIEAHFDLLLSLEAYNLYQLLWNKINPAQNLKPFAIWKRLLNDGANFRIIGDTIRSKQSQKQSVRQLLKIYRPLNGRPSPILNGRKIHFVEKGKT